MTIEHHFNSIWKCKSTKFSISSVILTKSSDIIASVINSNPIKWIKIWIWLICNNFNFRITAFPGIHGPLVWRSVKVFTQSGRFCFVDTWTLHSAKSLPQKNPRDFLNLHLVLLRPIDILPGSQIDMQVAPSHSKLF